METKFKIRVDGGEPTEFISRHSQYSLAVMEAFGRLSLPFPCLVEIWVPGLIPDYGPYHYKIDNFVDVAGHEYCCPAILTANQTDEGVA